jgi:uncharacterized protein
MQHRAVRFSSHGCWLDGDLYLPPRSRATPVPAVIPCSGYTGLKDMQPARFARALLPRGYACLTFDYRGFGASEGARGWLVPQEQVEDVRAATAFLTGLPEIDPARIALVGWGLGGGIAIAAAADDPEVRAVVALNAVGDAGRAARSTHDKASWQSLLQRIETDRLRRAAEGAASDSLHPYEVISLDEKTDAYVASEFANSVESDAYRAGGFGLDTTLQAAELLLRFWPEAVVERISPRPLLLLHGAENRLHPPEEAHYLYSRAREPKKLVLLAEAGHTEWMRDEHPIFQRAMSIIGEFLDEALR